MTHVILFIWMENNLFTKEQDIQHNNSHYIFKHIIKHYDYHYI